MITQKQKDLPYICIFKISSGDEIVAKVVDETMISYSVKMPLVMIGLDAGLRFAPFMLMADPDKTVSIPKPVITAEPAPALEDQYTQATTGIALPKRGLG